MISLVALTNKSLLLKNPKSRTFSEIWTDNISKVVQKIKDLCAWLFKVCCCRRPDYSNLNHRNVTKTEQTDNKDHMTLADLPPGKLPPENGTLKKETASLKDDSKRSNHSHGGSLVMLK